MRLVRIDPRRPCPVDDLLQTISEANSVVRQGMGEDRVSIPIGRREGDRLGGWERRSYRVLPRCKYTPVHKIFSLLTFWTEFQNTQHGSRTCRKFDPHFYFSNDKILTFLHADKRDGKLLLLSPKAVSLTPLADMLERDISNIFLRSNVNNIPWRGNPISEMGILRAC